MRILKKHEQTIIAIALVLINFLIKGVFLSRNPLSGDEPFSVYHAQMDTTSIIKLLSEGNNPPLYELLLHFWIKLFGISEIAVRFPSLIFSGITVLFIYLLGVKYLNKRIALYASIVFIFSNYHVLFAQEARVYSLLGMLSVISMYYFMGLLYEHEACKNRLKRNIQKKFIILIIVNTLIIYAHYFGFFIIITQFLFLLLNKSFILKYWKQILMSVILIALLYIPNIVVVMNRFVDSSSNGTWVKPPNGIDSIYNMLRLFSNAPVVAVFIITLLISSIVKYVLNKKNEQKNIFYRLIIFWFVFVFLFMFGVSYTIPMFLDRYLMPAAIAFSLLIGISVDYIIKTPKYNYIIPAIISLLFIVTIKPKITNTVNIKETIDKVKSIKNPNTQVLICPYHFALNFIYYYNIEIFKDYSVNDIYSNINRELKQENIYMINNINEVDFEKNEHIVYLSAAANFSYPNNNIINTLNNKYKLINKYEFNKNFNVYEFRLK